MFRWLAPAKLLCDYQSLKRLEEEMLPAGEEQVVIIHIDGVDSDGRVASTQESPHESAAAPVIFEHP